MNDNLDQNQPGAKIRVPLKGAKSRHSLNKGNNDFEEDFEDLNFDEMVRGINDYTRFMDEA